MPPAGMIRSVARLRVLLSLVLLAAAGLASPARAATCTVSTQAVAFGAYDALGAAPADTGPAYVTVTCSNFLPTTVAVRVNLGRGSATTYLPRRMQHLSLAGETLAYNLYADAPRSQVWGDGTGGTVSQQATLQVDACGWIILFCQGEVSYPLFGRIPPLQDVHTGLYQDTVQAQVIF